MTKTVWTLLPKIGGTWTDVRLDILVNYLAKSSVKTREILRITGGLIKNIQVAQSFHSSLVKEIMDMIEMKSSKFPQTFDCPTLWATAESLGQYALFYDAKVASTGPSGGFLFCARITASDRLWFK